MKDTTEIHIDEHFTGKRLDIFLHEKFPDFSRSALAKSITRGNVFVNRKPKKPSYMLKKGDLISLLSEFSSPYPSCLVPCPSLNISVLFENEHFLVIDKPAGIQVHPSGAEKEKTVANWLIAAYPDIANVGEDSMRPGIVHRLDKDTSGALIIAKTGRAFFELKKLFAERTIKKEYLAVVYGVPDPASGVINKPIARSASFRKQVIAEGHTKWKGTPREAVTHYEALKVIKSKVSKVSLKETQKMRHEEKLQEINPAMFYSLLTVSPKTGRMHQIRVHLASIGHSVVGDKSYARKKYKNFQTASRQLLHAHKISFSLFGENYAFTAPVPIDFEKFLLSES